MPEIWDAIVVGAGPAGSSLAARLGLLGRSVLLLDSARFPRDKMCGEYLGPGCLPLLGQIGAAEEVLRQAHPSSAMKAYSPGGIVFSARYPEGVQGLSLSRRKLDSILLECALRLPSVEVREGFRAERLLLDGDQVCGVTGGIPGGDGQTIRARVTVGADGRNSVVARGLGVFRWHPSHRRLALGRHFEGVQPPAEGLEMYGGGSLYGILNQQARGVVNVSLVLKQTTFGPWKGRLDAWFDALLGELPLLRERLACARALEPAGALAPLAHNATQVSAGGALLVGDAAGFYDPFTGEGVYMALEGARLAAEVVDRAIREHSCSRRFLKQYDAARAASLAGRYRMQSMIQRIVACPHMADWVATRLQKRERFAGRLMEILGDVRPPGDLLRFGF